MTALFLILFFGGLIVLAFPIATTILVSTASIPLFSGADTPLAWGQLFTESINGAVANNVGLTIVLFMIAGEFMAKGKLTEKIFDHLWLTSLGKTKALCPLSPLLPVCFTAPFPAPAPPPQPPSAAS